MKIKAKYILIICICIFAVLGGHYTAIGDETTVQVGPYYANLEEGILYGISYGTSIWQFTENIYSFDNDITVTDAYGVVISGGDVDNSMKVMIDIDKPYTLNLLISGDINMDNVIDEKDVEILRKYILSNKDLSKKKLLQYDINMDSIVDISDIIAIENVINGYKTTVNPIVNSGTMNYPYSKMVEDINELAIAYPNLADVKVIGKTHFDRDIYAIRIGNLEAKNHILIHGGIHGREHMTCMLIMDQAEYLLSKSQDLFDNREIYYHLQNTCIHFIPMANPDGIMLSQRGILSVPDAFKSQIPNIINMSDNGDFSTWKANGAGIDLNRNFDGSYDGISKQSPGADTPSFENYGGDEYFTEPESIALRDYTLSYNFDITVSYHSTGEMIFWFYNQAEDLLAINYQLACTVGSITGYEVLDAEMPVSTSGYKDWAIEKLKIPSLTVETGNAQTPLPYSQYQRIWQAHRLMPLELIKFNGAYPIE